jgi:hypothetical protein
MIRDKKGNIVKANSEILTNAGQVSSSLSAIQARQMKK